MLMLTSADGYTLTYLKRVNQIVIGLPQTTETLTNTRGIIVDRRTDVEEGDLWAVLNVARIIFDKGERKDGETDHNNA